MLQTTRDALRALLPQTTDEEIEATAERLRRYIELAVAIAETSRKSHSEEGLTPSMGGGSVNAGQVEPRTFKNTG